MRISKSTHRVARFAAVVLSVFLAVAASGGSALAQTDLDGSDLIVTGSGPWNLSYTNSNNSSQSIVAIYNLVNATRYDYTGSFTGNIFIDVNHNGYASNDNSTDLIARIESLDGQHVLEAAERLGVGSRAYELVEID